jgi:hypothetical protein
MTSLTRAFIILTPLSDRQHYLERPSVGGAREHVVGLVELVQPEVMGDEPPGVDLAGGDPSETR